MTLLEMLALTVYVCAPVQIVNTTPHAWDHQDQLNLNAARKKCLRGFAGKKPCLSKFLKKRIDPDGLRHYVYICAEKAEVIE